MTITTTDTNLPVDEVFIEPATALPDALILRGSTVITTTLDGDHPVVRVPWVDDAEATFEPEGAVIERSEPQTSMTSIATAKIAQIIWVSNEAWRDANASKLLSTSMLRAIHKKADEAFITATPEAGLNPLTGISSNANIIDGGAITDSLDPLADAIAQAESNGGQPNLIIANPLAWGALRNLKTGTGANTTLLGAGTEDAQKRLLGIEVVTSGAVPAGELLVLDSAATAAAVGPVRVAQSEHAAFDSDSTALRVTWRIGWRTMHENRIAKVTVTT